jgi:Fe-S oxidoreductase
MLTVPEKIIFALLTVASLSYAYIHFRRMFRIINRGSGELNYSELPKRILTGILALFNQGRILRDRPVTSLFHYAVAWGFIVYILVNIVDVLEGYSAGFHFLGDTLAANLYLLLADILTVGVLVGIIYLIIRRFIARTPALQTRENVKLMPEAARGIPLDSVIVGGFIFLHVGFRLSAVSFLVAQEGGDSWQPFASLAAHIWYSFSLSEEALTIGWHISWWIALGLILAFIPYFPYSKHAHLFMGPLNFMVKNRGSEVGSLTPVDFEDESIEQYGAARLTELQKQHILDAYACIMCNRCQDACPAYVTGKELSPSALEINKRYYVRTHARNLATGTDGDELPLLEYAISEEAVWACTTCGACVDICPVANEPMFDIVHMRRNQVMMESAFPAELKNTFQNLERNFTPWAFSHAERAAWADGLDIPVASGNPDFEFLYWVGCAGSYDNRYRKVSRAFSQLMKIAGIKFAILGNEEKCNGDTARRLGNEYLAQTLMKENVETLNRYKVRKIVTTCPHCFNIFSNEYPDFGGTYEVIHHTDFLRSLVHSGRIKVSKEQHAKIIYHDSCYLGRYNSVYDSPRDILKSIAGVELAEMRRSRDKGFCCGAGGGRMWMEEKVGKSVNIERTEEALSLEPNIIGTACPFCMTMMSDGVKAKERGDDVAVKDIAELLLEAVQENSPG